MNYKIDIIDTNGDGNCFFRALYGYAFHNKLNAPADNKKLKNKLFEQLFYCFNCDVTNLEESGHTEIKDCDTVFSKKCLGKFPENRYANEEYFVHCLRNSLKNRIENGFNESDKKLKDTFDSLQDMDKETYKTIIEVTYPKEFCTKFPTQSFTYNEFKNYFAESIGTDGYWVSETNIKIIQHILSKCGIDIHIYNNIDNIPSIPSSIQRNAWEHEHLNIYLINFDNAHYGFVLYKETFDGIGTVGTVGTVGTASKRGIKRKTYGSNKIMLNGKIRVK